MSEGKLLANYDVLPMDDFVADAERWTEWCADEYMDQQDLLLLGEVEKRTGVRFNHYDIARIFFTRQRSGQSVSQVFQTVRKIFRMQRRWGVFIHRDHRAYSGGRRLAGEQAAEMAQRVIPGLSIRVLPLIWWRFGAVLIVRRNALSVASR